MSTLQLSEYQASWPEQFLLVAHELRSAVAASSAVIEHIGSTAVPGLCAKPVLDILLGVTALSDVDAAQPGLAAAGFLYRREYEKQIPDRRYFVRSAGVFPRVHLHAVSLGGLLWQQHLYFRNRLREDTELRNAYANLKKELASVHASDKAAYTSAKAPFIEQVLSSHFARSTGPAHGAA